MKKRRTSTGLVVLVVVAGGGWAWQAARPRAPQARVAVTAATRGEFVVSLPAEGALQSDDSVTVRAGKAPGQVTMIVPDGTVVRAGDVFCRIEARDLLRQQTDAELANKQALEEIANAREMALERVDMDQRTADQAEKDFQVWEKSIGITTKEAEDQLAFDQAEAERLRLEYARSQRMADKGYQAGSEAEVAKATYEAQQFKVEQSAKDLEVTRSQIASQRRQKQAQVEASRRRVSISAGRINRMVGWAKRRADVTAKRLEQIVASLADTTIRAPVSGTVALFSTFRGGERRSWREGDQVSSGTPLGSISGSASMSVRCRIKESLIAELQAGQAAEVEFDALVGKRFSGVISTVGVVAREVLIEEDPTAQPGERVFDVLVKVKQGAATGLRPGLNARVRITVKTLPQTLFVPVDCVFEREGRSFVYVKRGDDFAPRDVKTGERNEVAVVLLQGLAEGELAALSDPTRGGSSRESQSP